MSKRARANPPCPYGDECSRSNPAHLEAYAHGDEECLSEMECLELLSRRKASCQYGTRCTRKDKVHFFETEHPAALLQRDPFPNPRVRGGQGAAAAWPSFLASLLPAAVAAALPSFLGGGSSSSSSSSSAAAPAPPTARLDRAPMPEPRDAGDGSGEKLPEFVTVFQLMRENDDGFGDNPLLRPRTKLDRKVDALKHEIKLKPDYARKAADDAIVAKWAAEVPENDRDCLARAVAEVRFEAADAGPNMWPAPISLVWQGDGLVPDGLLARLVDAFAALEDGPKDWHPGSTKQVLDLVHPSLYCFVADRSVVLPKASVGVGSAAAMRVGHDPELAAQQQQAPAAAAAAPPPPRPVARSVLKGVETAMKRLIDQNRRQMYRSRNRSTRYAWLPAELDVSADGAAVEWRSYINNLHPQRHAALYADLAEAFRVSALPLFERVLSSLAAHKPPRRADVDMYDLYEKPDNEEDEDDDDYYENRPLKPIKLLPFDADAAVRPPPLSLRGRRLQVIVKMATTVLTPDAPEFAGGVWHCEGMENENIVATAIVYADSHNITESRLAFRTMRANPEYEQSDDRGVEHVYGLADEDVMNDEIGYIVTRSGRAAAFPNVWQHKVGGFRLADPSQRGWRRVLVFFLCDPNKEVLSTARVPPQQPDWLADALLPELSPFMSSPDVRRMVASYAAGVSREEAEADRLGLMEERSSWYSAQEDETFEREFSLCEH